MMPVQAAIARFRRDLTLGALLKIALLVVAMVALIVPGLLDLRGVDLLILVLVAAVWVALSVRGAQGSRVAAGFAGLIASGQYGAAEQQIEQLLQRFSVSRASKLLSMHHLAALRHAQRRFGDAAALCRELLGQRLGHLKGLSRASRLILADSLLELNDPVSAYHAMVPLYQQRLPLGEALALLSIQLDYQARTGAWAAITEQIATKVQLTELMPPGPAVRAQALLAVAAQRCGKDDWSRWLIQRVELQSDVQELCARRPMLWELWSRPSA